MIRVFGYLTYCTLQNRVFRQLRHLKSPRYIFAFVLGGAYVWMVLLRPGARQMPSPAINAHWLELAGSIALALAVAWGWVFGRDRRVLTFSPAEVQFLFSAPVARRGLIQFKLLRSQLVILLNSLLWTVILIREKIGVSPWLRAISLWALLSTLQLHRLGSSFVRTTLAEHGLSGAKHRTVSLTVLGTVLIALMLSVADGLPLVAQAWSSDVLSFFIALTEIAERPLPAALLFPFRLMIQPLAATSVSEWLHAFPAALGLLVLHYIWVVRSDSAFEEAAAEAALKRAKALAESEPAARSAAVGAVRLSPSLFPLRPLGWPPMAILWKNLVALTRLQRVANALIALGAVGGVIAVASFKPESTVAEVAGALAATWAGFLIVVGPQWVRNDLRADLRKLDLLRSYPLSGAGVVTAEVAASTLVLTLAQLTLLLLAYLAFLGNHTLELTLWQRTILLGAAVVLLPWINFLAMLIQNAAALLFPAWVHLGSGRPGGVEALGQNLLTMIASLALLSLALVAPVVLGAGTFYLLRPYANLWALVPAALLAVAGMLLEVVLFIDWLGGVFDRTDPSAAGISVVGP